MCPLLAEGLTDLPFNCSQFTIRYSSSSMLVCRGGARGGVNELRKFTTKLYELYTSYVLLLRQQVSTHVFTKD